MIRPFLWLDVLVKRKACNVPFLMPYLPRAAFIPMNKKICGNKLRE